VHSFSHHSECNLAATFVFRAGEAPVSSHIIDELRRHIQELVQENSTFRNLYYKQLQQDQDQTAKDYYQSQAKDRQIQFLTARVDLVNRQWTRTAEEAGGYLDTIAVLEQQLQQLTEANEEWEQVFSVTDQQLTELEEQNRQLSAQLTAARGINQQQGQEAPATPKQ